MKKYSIQRYTNQDALNWNTFVANCKNATFLHNRNFMDYHVDRFKDFSLIVIENNKWAAVLPANIENFQIHSHQGLTYGGLLHDQKVKQQAVIEILKQILVYFNDAKITTIYYKCIPSIYHQVPYDAINYALFLANANLYRRDCLSVLDLTKKNKIIAGRIEGIKKGSNKNLEIRETNNFDDFWNIILIPHLKQKFDTKPVHSLEEISRLKKLFPDNIRQFNVYQDNKIVAGTTIFEDLQVAHAQYICADNSKSLNGSLDYLYHYLITDIFKNKRFFDFGISNENNGKKLNGGLIFWKESFGASTIVQDFYEIDTKNFVLLENITT